MKIRSKNINTVEITNDLVPRKHQEIFVWDFIICFNYAFDSNYYKEKEKKNEKTRGRD